MLGRAARRVLRTLAVEHGKGVRLFRKFGHPTAEENAKLWKPLLYSMGEDVGIVIGTEILDPAWVRIGNNVLLANCRLVGHDGSIAVLNRAYGVRLDRVGKIDIRDNVFIGHQAIIMPNVVIGPNAIVAAGAVVTRDVPENSIVGGVPARKIGDLAETVKRLVESTAKLPWADIIAQRDGAYDPALEPELNRQRIAHFFGDG